MFIVLNQDCDREESPRFIAAQQQVLVQVQMGNCYIKKIILKKIFWHVGKMSSCLVKRLHLSNNLQALKDETRCSILFSLFLNGALPSPLLCCLSDLLASQCRKLADSYPVFVGADSVSHMPRVRHQRRTGASAREGRVELLRKWIEERGAGPLHTLALSLRITSAVLCLLHLTSNVCLGVFFPNNKKKIRSPKCKCIHVTFLPVFNSASSGIAFYVSCIKNNVRNASRSCNGYLHLSKANNSLKDKCFGRVKEPHVLFNFHAIKVLLLAADTAAFLNYKTEIKRFICVVHNNKIHRLDVFKQILFKTVIIFT